MHNLFDFLANALSDHTYNPRIFLCYSIITTVMVLLRNYKNKHTGNILIKFNDISWMHH